MNDGALPERKCLRCGVTVGLFGRSFGGLCARCDEVARAHVRFEIENPAEAEPESVPLVTIDQLMAQLMMAREWCAKVAERSAKQTAAIYPDSERKHVCERLGRVIAHDICGTEITPEKVLEAFALPPAAPPEGPARPSRQSDTSRTEALRVQQWGLFYRHARPFIRTGLALLLMMRRNPAFAKDSYALADNFLAELEKDLAVWEKQ
jgi:hypothetical protein